MKDVEKFLNPNLENDASTLSKSALVLNQLIGFTTYSGSSRSNHGHNLGGKTQRSAAVAPSAGATKKAVAV